MLLDAESARTAIEVDLATRRKAEILCGSIRVIARDGVASAKLKDIALESGVSLGLIQHYFGTRDELVNATFQVMMQATTLSARDAVPWRDDPLMALLSLLRLHVTGTVAFSERWQFWIELWAASGRSAHTRRVGSRIYQLWGAPVLRALEGLQLAGRISPTADLDRLALGTLALMDGLSIRAVVDPEVVSAESMFELLIDSLSATLGLDRALVHDARIRLEAGPADPRHAPLSPELIAEALLAQEADAAEASSAAAV